MRSKLIFIFLLGIFIFSNNCAAQNDSILSLEQIKKYAEQSRQIVNYLEGTLNFLGNPNELPSDKDIIFNESYMKIFVDDKVQVEDDLDENREIPLNKDVQAYLKDIDFFFKQVKFNFEIDEIEQLVTDNNVLVFKLSLNRHIEGITVGDDTVNNNQLRYIEINFDPLQNDLKIASIYTTKIQEKEELKYWWNTMSSEWKNFFGSSIIVYDTLPLKNIIWFSDTSIVTMKWTQTITADTALLIDDDITDPPLFAADTLLIVYDTVTNITPDTITVNTNTIYRLLKTFRKIQKIDISNNLIIYNLDPVSELSELVEINISNTLIDNLTPIRNLKKLEVFECSGSSVSDIGSLRYISTLKEINISNTLIENIDVLKNLNNVTKLDLSNSKVIYINALSELIKLSHLKISNTGILDLSPLNNLSLLSDLNISNTKIESLGAIDSISSIQNLNIDSTLIKNLRPLSSYSSLSILQANNTGIYDLSPLNNLGLLKVIYCDNSKIKLGEASTFMDNNPSCLVIYNSQELVNWWNGLSAEWQNIFKTTYGISVPVTKEKLHYLINQNTLSIAYNRNIKSLDPLSMLHRLEVLELQNTSINDLTPLSGLSNLEVLNLVNTDVKSLDPLSSLHNIKQIMFDETKIADISPLSGSNKLEVIYCDKTGVTNETVLEFKVKNNDCLIIYQSDKLRMWWNNVDSEWQSVLRSQLDLPQSPSKEELQKLVNLSSLVIVNNMSLSNLSPLHMFLLLEELTVNNTSITDISPILSLSNLKKLNLAKNPIFNLESISQLFKLKELRLENTSVEDLEPISKLKNLIILDVAGTKIKSLKYIKSLGSLEKLYINNTRIKNLKPLFDLSKLDLLQCYNTSIKSSRVDEFKRINPKAEVTYY